MKKKGMTPQAAYEKARSQLKKPTGSLAVEKELRDNACKLLEGQDYEYTKDARIFAYKYLGDFSRKSRYAKFQKENCSKTPTITKKLDAMKTRFKDVRTEPQCKNVGGTWDRKRIADDRKGVCWTNENQAKCGRHESISLGKYRSEQALWLQEFSIWFRSLANEERRAWFDSNKKISSKPYPKRIFAFASNLVESKRECRKHARKGCVWYKEHCLHILRDPDSKFFQGIKATLKAKRMKDEQRKKMMSMLKNIEKRSKEFRLKRNVQEYKDKMDKAKRERVRAFIKRGATKWKKASQNAPFPDDWPIDATQEDIQTFLEAFFTSPRAPKYQALVGEGNRCTFGKRFTPTLPQRTVSYMMKGLANPENENRGMIAIHSTGAGKTILATLTMDAFWDTDKRIVFATSAEALRSNSERTFAKNLINFTSRFKNRSEEYALRKLKERNVEFKSFAQLAHTLQLHHPTAPKKGQTKQGLQNYLDDAVLILDEVQNLFHPLANQKAENNALRKFLVNNKTNTRNLKTLIMTATPGDDPKEVAELLNIVRDRRKPVIKVPKADTIQEFRDSVRGLVSYYDASGDLTRFPALKDNFVYELPMSAKQFEAYKDAYAKDKAKKVHTGDKFWTLSRKYSNTLHQFPTNPEEFSAKIPKFMSLLETYPDDKHWLYSAFYTKTGHGGHGVVSIAKSLEKEMKYTQLTVNQAKKALDASGKFKITPGKRYILAISTELTKVTDLSHLVDIYNHPDNKHGEYVQVFLASQKYNEGVDLKAVRHVHLFEPLLTSAKEKQAIGRARRFCSHTSLDKENWDVKVHRYLSVAPKDTKNNMNNGKTKESVEREIQEVEKGIENTKAGRGKKLTEEMKTERKKLQDALKILKVELKTVASKQRKSKQGPVEMIDEIVKKRADALGLEMDTIIKTLASSAVDCKLLKTFHKNVITCAR